MDENARIARGCDIVNITATIRTEHWMGPCELPVKSQQEVLIALDGEETPVEVTNFLERYRKSVVEVIRHSLTTHKHPEGDEPAYAQVELMAEDWDFNGLGQFSFTIEQVTGGEDLWRVEFETEGEPAALRSVAAHGMDAALVLCKTLIDIKTARWASQVRFEPPAPQAE